MEIGIMRQEMQIEHKKLLEKIINDNSHKDIYYVLVCCKPHELLYGVIKTTFMIIDKEPFNKLKQFGGIMGTIAYCIDNKKGKLSREWTLPLDVPFDVEYEDEVEEIFNSALLGNINYIY